MNIWDILIILAVAAIVTAAIRTLKKSSCGCGENGGCGDCSQCSRRCDSRKDSNFSVEE